MPSEHCLKKHEKPFYFAADLSTSYKAQAGKNYDVQGVMSGLIRFKLKPDDLSDELVPTVGTNLEITGKSITTLFNMVSLLKLSDEIQAAIRAGNLPVSQGHLFAANLECPDLRNSVEF